MKSKYQAFSCLLAVCLLTVGGIDVAAAQSGDTKYGTNALENDLGSANSAFGYYALQASTTSAGNTATGYEALYSDTTGGSNTADGDGAMQNNTTGEQNVAVGGS